MRTKHPSKPTRNTVGFLLPSERRMVNRQRVLQRAGLEDKALFEATGWIAASPWAWLRARRFAVVAHHAA